MGASYHRGVQEFAPQRVVSLQPSVAVTLDGLDLSGRIVACTKWCAEMVPSLAERGVAIVADSWSAQAEQIAAARPDLVIASVPYQLEAVSEILKAGIRFVAFAPRTLTDVYADMAAIAGLMQAEPAGAELIHRMQDEIRMVREATAGRARLRVFCEEWGKPLIASQHWVAELIESAGAIAVGEPGKQISPEAIRASDPDVLVAAWCGAGNRVPLEKIVQQRGWEQMTAVRAGRVYCFPDEWLNTPAITLLEGLRAFAAVLHPDRFEMPARVRRLQTAVV